MANLGTKNGSYLLRFRYLGKEYKRSLQTDDHDDALDMQQAAERTMRRLQRGALHVPDRVDPIEFILSGGALTIPAAVSSAEKITTRTLIAEYLASEKPRPLRPTTRPSKSTCGTFSVSWTSATTSRAVPSAVVTLTCTCSSGWPNGNPVTWKKSELPCASSMSGPLPNSIWANRR